MTESKDLIIITASCGKNLELSKKFLEKSNDLKISSEILDLTTLDIPLFNPRIHSKENIPNEIEELKKKLFEIERWVICAPEYNVSGKTGTAEDGEGGLDHAWFVCFTPYENSELLVVAFAQNTPGGGSVHALPMAREILKVWNEKK